MAFPTGYTKYQNVTVDNTKVAATLTDYPLYIDLSDMDVTTDIFDTCRSDGGDIRCTLSDGTTQLAREVVSIDTTAKTGELHVKIPSLASGSDTIIRVWYNGVDTEPAIDSTYGAENAWNSNYMMVQHMNEDPSGSAPQLIDSTSNDNDGTSNGSMTSGDSVSGQIGSALDFDGIDDYISIPDSSTLDPAAAFTYSIWFNPDATDARGRNQKYDATTEDGYNLGQWDTGTGVWDFRVWVSGTVAICESDSAPDGGWQHIVGVRESGGGMTLYVDGVAQADTETNSGAIDSTQELRIGTSAFLSSYFSGQIDEVRFLDDALTANWLSTEYNNQNSPSTFYSVSEEQEVSTGNPWYFYSQQ